jgi:formylglycine-generating enzyme required for sulfatase activity
MRHEPGAENPPKYSRSDSLAGPPCVVVPGGLVASASRHRVAAFRLGRTPVTRIEYATFLASGRAAIPPWWNDPRFARDAQPVVGVTWHEASAFCDWIGEHAGGRWRLPSEAEWEHAANGGLDAPRTAWGDRVPEGEIPEGPLDAPWDAGRGTANGYGLLDIGTLVHEWCLDAVAPSAPGGPERRASRGGSWRHAIRWTPPASRSSLPHDFRYSDYGFRVLREEEGAG